MCGGVGSLVLLVLVLVLLLVMMVLTWLSRLRFNNSFIKRFSWAVDRFGLKPNWC